MAADTVLQGVEVITWGIQIVHPTLLIMVMAPHREFLTRHHGIAEIETATNILLTVEATIADMVLNLDLSMDMINITRMVATAQYLVAIHTVNTMETTEGLVIQERLI